jgi:hypothetical protein
VQDALLVLGFEDLDGRIDELREGAVFAVVVVSY